MFYHCATQLVVVVVVLLQCQVLIIIVGIPADKFCMTADNTNLMTNMNTM